MHCFTSAVPPVIGIWRDWLDRAVALARSNNLHFRTSLTG
ncbi:hypothetical protein AB395_0000320 [Sinorhizobium fredii CCBAU 45436]|nr:hypothetical protein SF83666_c02980 [Sinorhizobium fredii CCBAU 83666]AWI56002.1 hypothetical protein AB395_0000320 [Sinorhizobium fredii CCBAU 45436]